jgi:hypothetical protein
MAECHAVGCRALILPYALFCDECWRKCPSDLKRLIEKHHRPRRRPSKVLERWIAQAVKELLFLKRQGHYRPRDGSFQWDDDAPATTERQESLLE